MKNPIFSGKKYCKKSTLWYHIIENNNQKEGALNEKLVMKKLLTYINSVYQLKDKINRIKDKRKRISIPLSNIIWSVLLGFILQYPSFNEIFSYNTTRKRFKHVLKGKIPKVDAARLVLTLISKEDIRTLIGHIVRSIIENKTFRNGTINGYKVVGIDGVELFSSNKKICENCLTRTHSNGVTDYFHRSVVCMTVGCDPHIIIGEETLYPRDGNEKDEGENTGAKRLLKRLYKEHHHFADIIVGDALYLNAPFMNTVTSIGMDYIIRSKDDNRLIIQDAMGLMKEEGKKPRFKNGNIEVVTWDLCGFHMEGVKEGLRVLKFVEYHWKEGTTKVVWVVTNNFVIDYRTIWLIIHKRWDIELNGFHQLKTYYHANHCFHHEATEVVFMLMVVAFNLREMFIFKRMKIFNKRKMTRREITIMLKDDLLINNYTKLFDSG